jgi:glutamate racemase
LGADLLAGQVQGRGVAPLTRPPRVAVVDSGLGGLTVHAEVAKAVPGAALTYLADDGGFPYGRLSEAALVGRVMALVTRLMEEVAPDLVVLACNTASTLVLPHLRAAFPIPFVGTVPAIKPAAAASKSRCISVLATPGTVARDYTRALVAAHAQGCAVTLIGSPHLATYAEDELRGIPAADAALAAELAPAFVEEGGRRTDVVVLACTHFPLLRERLAVLAPWPVAWIDPAPAIARRVAALLGPAAPGPVPPPRALFTAGRVLPPALLAGLARRGPAEVGQLALPPVAGA